MKKAAQNHDSPPVVLASSSRYRRELLARLGLEVRCDPPNIDETALENEPPAATAARLSLAKAQSIASRHPLALIIASDQVAELDGHAIGKPGSIENARSQLQRCAGREVIFHTGLCLLNAGTGNVQLCVEPFTVVFRQLSEPQIANYIQREPALDCAGSFKSEGLGISLFSAMRGEDPNSLIGLPLIKLVDFLEQEDFPVLA